MWCFEYGVFPHMLSQANTCVSAGVMLGDFNGQLQHGWKKCFVTGVLWEYESLASAPPHSASCLLVYKCVIFLLLAQASTSAHWCHAAAQLWWTVTSLGQEDKVNSFFLNCHWSWYFIAVIAFVTLIELKNSKLCHQNSP